MKLCLVGPSWEAFGSRRLRICDAAGLVRDLVGEGRRIEKGRRLMPLSLRLAEHPLDQLDRLSLSRRVLLDRRWKRLPEPG